MANGDTKAGILSNVTLWDAKDVARYLKVSRSWVYHHAERGLLPCLRIGALLRFEPAKVQEFALGCRAGTAPATVAPAVTRAGESQAASERR